MHVPFLGNVLVGLCYVNDLEIISAFLFFYYACVFSSLHLGGTMYYICIFGLCHLDVL